MLAWFCFHSRKRKEIRLHSMRGPRWGLSRYFYGIAIDIEALSLLALFFAELSFYEASNVSDVVYREFIMNFLMSCITWRRIRRAGDEKSGRWHRQSRAVASKRHSDRATRVMSYKVVAISRTAH